MPVDIRYVVTSRRTGSSSLGERGREWRTFWPGMILPLMLRCSISSVFARTCRTSRAKTSSTRSGPGEGALSLLAGDWRGRLAACVADLAAARARTTSLPSRRVTSWWSRASRTDGSAPWKRSQRSSSARFTGGSGAEDGHLGDSHPGGGLGKLFPWWRRHSSASSSASVRLAFASSAVRPWLMALRHLGDLRADPAVLARHQHRCVGQPRPFIRYLSHASPRRRRADGRTARRTPQWSSAGHRARRGSHPLSS